MNRKLYPLTFIPLRQERVWGAESWEISSMGDGAESIVASGFLAENTLGDLVETYLGQIVGDRVFDRYGLQFPLLIKRLEVNELLSVQVHPSDETAAERYDQYGKDECWLVTAASPRARIYMGFKRDTSAAEFYRRCKEGTVEELLNVYVPKPGDFFHIPAGTVHACGGGLTIAEVQESSDMTFRLYDWGRENDPATARKMHLEEAIDCIDFNRYDEKRLHVPAGDDRELLAENDHFTVKRRRVESPLILDMDRFESCLIYYCLEGSATVSCEGAPEEAVLSPGGCVLIPWGVGEATLTPSGAGATLLQATIPAPEEADDYINPEAAAELPGETDKEQA